MSDFKYLLLIHFYSTPDASDSEWVSIEIEKENAEAISLLLQHSLPINKEIATLYSTDKIVVSISLI